MDAEPLAGSQRITNDPGDDSGPRWFPDGQRIVFYGFQRLTYQDNQGYQIFVIDDDGSNLTRLTDGLFNNTNPDFSPDGMKIAFESSRVVGSGIFVMNNDGTSLTQLQVDGRYPRWNPDGTKIAYSLKGGRVVDYER